jgi:DNA adenine methylase
MNMNPPLKWAGGKRWLVPRLSELFAPFRTFRLVEPFTGGASVTLGLEPSAALCADLNAPLINFYQQLKRGLVIPALELDEAAFYRNRTRFNEIYRNPKNAGETVEAAALFYYLNRRCFNGLCRFNSKGGFNLPFFKEANRPLPALDDYRAALANVEFVCADFSKLALTADDFVYADPPYDKSFTSYTAEGFAWADQVRCAEWLAAHPGPVVASNLATDRIVELYERLGFRLDYVQGPRRIAVPKKIDKIADRKPVREMLAMKNL